MNRNFLIGLTALILAVILLGYWWMPRQSAKPPAQPATTSSASANITTNNLPNPTPVPAPNTTTSSTRVDTPPDHQAEAQREKKVWDLLLATPIIFYGKVVDTQGNPIAGVTASISAADHVWEGSSKYEKITGNDGLFSIATHGLGLVVNVSKEGYYRMEQSGGVFGYSASAGKTNPHPSSSDPAVFVLRKKGQTEHLIVTQGTIKIASDGTARAMSLTTGHTWIVPNGDIMVQAWIQDQGVPVNSNQHYDWRCVITVPGGGIQKRTGGEFDFEAPTDGYQASDEIAMPATATPWSSSASRGYFLRLGNGDYARIDFAIAAENPHQFEITSYLNPTPGHRNLEYDPKQQASQ